VSDRPPSLSRSRPVNGHSASRWATGIRNARYAVTSRYWVNSYSWHYVYRSVNIQGLGFFDVEHNVTGAAPNNIELHPVTYIRFN